MIVMQQSDADASFYINPVDDNDATCFYIDCEEWFPEGAPKWLRLKSIAVSYIVTENNLRIPITRPEPG